MDAYYGQSNGVGDMSADADYGFEQFTASEGLMSAGSYMSNNDAAGYGHEHVQGAEPSGLVLARRGESPSSQSSRHESPGPLPPSWNKYVQTSYVAGAPPRERPVPRDGLAIRSDRMPRKQRKILKRRARERDNAEDENEDDEEEDEAENIDEHSSINRADFYGKPLKSPQPWGWVRRGSISNVQSFRYNKFGELDYSIVFSKPDLETYLYGKPRSRLAKHKHAGQAWVDRQVLPGEQYVMGKRRSGLTLWIGWAPAQANDRLPSSDFSNRCRFKDCPSKHRKFRGGQPRVAFDERMNVDGAEFDPFHVAGYMHLFCLEEQFNIIELISHLDVRLDTRDFVKEDNPASFMKRENPELKIQAANKWLDREWQREAHWQGYLKGLRAERKKVQVHLTREQATRPRNFNDSLTKNMVETDVNHYSASGTKSRKMRKQTGNRNGNRPTDAEDHLGNIWYIRDIMEARSGKAGARRNKQKANMDRDDEGLLHRPYEPAHFIEGFEPGKQGRSDWDALGRAGPGFQPLPLDMSNRVNRVATYPPSRPLTPLAHFPQTHTGQVHRGPAMMFDPSTLLTTPVVPPSTADMPSVITAQPAIKRTRDECDQGYRHTGDAVERIIKRQRFDWSDAHDLGRGVDPASILPPPRPVLPSQIRLRRSLEHNARQGRAGPIVYLNRGLSPLELSVVEQPEHLKRSHDDMTGPLEHIPGLDIDFDNLLASAMANPETSPPPAKKARIASPVIADPNAIDDAIMAAILADHGENGFGSEAFLHDDGVPVGFPDVLDSADNVPQWFTGQSPDEQDYNSDRTALPPVSSFDDNILNFPPIAAPGEEGFNISNLNHCLADDEQGTLSRQKDAALSAESGYPDAEDGGVDLPSIEEVIGQSDAPVAEEQEPEHEFNDLFDSSRSPAPETEGLYSFPSNQTDEAALVE